jgi:hypothetical protein
MYIHAYKYTYIYLFIYTYIHTYIHAYTHSMDQKFAKLTAGCWISHQHTKYVLFIIFSGSVAQHGLWPPLSRGFLITHNDAPQLVELLRTSDQFVAETSTWQHTQQTNIHAPSGIWTHDHSRRAAVDLRLRSHGHWDRHKIYIGYVK